MYDSNSKGISFFAGFFMLISFTIAAIILAGALSLPVWESMTGRPFEEMEKGLSNPAYSDAVKMIQVITAVIGFLLPALVTAFLMNNKPMRLLGFTSGFSIKQVILVLFIMCIALVVSGSLSYFNSAIPIPDSWRITFDEWESAYEKQIEAIVTLDNPGQFIIALFIMAFLPALCEEALFRGGLQNFLTKATRLPWLSIIIVSLIFSAVHFSWYGFLSRFFLGIVLGVLFQYSGKLWLSIIAHFFNNALAITLLYIAKQNGKTFEEAMNEGVETYWGIVALPVLIVLLIWFRNISKKRIPPEHPIPGRS